MNFPPALVAQFRIVAQQENDFPQSVEAINHKLLYIAARGASIKLNRLMPTIHVISMRQRLNLTRAAKSVQESQAAAPNLASVARRLDQVIKQGISLRSRRKSSVTINK
jgi:hypothetical protein